MYAKFIITVTMQDVHIIGIHGSATSVAQKIHKFHTNNSQLLEMYGSVFQSIFYSVKRVSHHVYIHYHKYKRVIRMGATLFLPSCQHVFCCQYYTPHKQNTLHSHMGMFSAFNITMCNEQTTFYPNKSGNFLHTALEKFYSI